MREHLSYRSTLQQIEMIIRRAALQEDDFLRAQVAQHACVRLSGTIENAVRDNIIRMVGASSHPRAVRFISRRLADFQNPKPYKIIDLLEALDSGWAASLSDQWEPEIKDAIGSIVGQRNIIAHGGTTDVTLGRVSGWLKQTNYFCDIIERFT